MQFSLHNYIHSLIYIFHSEGRVGSQALSYNIIYKTLEKNQSTFFFTYNGHSSLSFCVKKNRSVSHSWNHA